MNAVRKCVNIFLLLSLHAVSIHAQVFDWVRAIGGEAGMGIAIDALGNSYVTGTYSRTIVIDQIELTNDGGMDIFIAKYDAAGNLKWAKHGGSTGDDYSGGIAVDAMGNCYVTGYFLGSASFGTKTVIGNGSYDVFLAKYDAKGECIWLRSAGGTSDDWGEAVAVDAKGDIFLAGNFQQTASFENQQISTYGDRDVFVARYDSLGNCLWVQHAGGPGIEECRGISTDKYGNSYITGYFSYSATFGVDTLSSRASREIFIAKYDGAGFCKWAKQAQGSSVNMGNAISTDPNGTSTITGYYLAPTKFEQVSLPAAGAHNAFIARYDMNGVCQWARNAGGNQTTIGYGVSVDKQGNSYVTGIFSGSVDFGNQSPVSSVLGGSDAFIVKYDQKGNCMWVSSAGGAGQDNCNAIAIDLKGSIWMTGTAFTNAIFGPLQVPVWGAFITKFNEGITGVNEVPAHVPAESRLMQNYPNPFNPSTTIGFVVQQAGGVSIKLYDMAGREAAVIVNAQLSPGTYSVVFDGSRLPSGIYYYKMTALRNGTLFTEAKRMVLLK